MSMCKILYAVCSGMFVGSIISGTYVFHGYVQKHKQKEEQEKKLDTQWQKQWQKQWEKTQQYVESLSIGKDENSSK